VIFITGNTEEVKQVKGSMPRAIKMAKEMDDDFGQGLAGFYKAIWKDREDGLSMKNKHLIVFAIACSRNNTNSAKKILVKLKKHGATRAEVLDAMMMAAWAGGIQNFTDISTDVLPEMDKLGY
jgi:alkylhydroperoxidase/carboxymuconolactone decarboxylase family protein YurZ